MKPRNARFWIWWADGWVKLTLRPGQSLSFGYRGPSDEGWHSHGETYSHEGDRVTSNITTDGRDCDGRFQTFDDFVCQLDQLAAREVWNMQDDRLERRAPAWIALESYQRDHSAEAMGY